MTQFNLTLLVIGFLVIFLGVFSGFFKNKGISEPFIALFTGIILGPNGLNILTPEKWGESGPIVKEAARLTLAIGLMSVALRIPDYVPFRQKKDLLILLLVVMPGMLVISSLLTIIILDISIWTAVLIGAIVSPTDPVVASSIVTGKVAKKNLPLRIRNLISAESGFNDGLAYLFVLLPFLILNNHPSPVFHWFLKGFLWEIGSAIVLGVVFGVGAGKILIWAEKREYIEKPSILSYTIALALLVVSLIKLLHSDGILGVFVAGVALNLTINATQRAEEERVTEGFDRFFTLPVFTLLGVYLPVQEWLTYGWKLFAAALLILIIKRLPLLIILKKQLKSIKNIKEALFVGWFGPVGVAALFYAHMRPEIQRMQEVWHVTSLVITCSVILHGFTSTYFSRKLSKNDDNGK